MTTLARIRTKVRRLTGSPNPSQLTDADIDDAVNTFYTQDFPANLKTFNLRENYEFWTQPNVETYNFPLNTYTNAQPPLYADGFEVAWTQSQEEFYGYYPQLETINETASAGDGTAGPYAFTLASVPILQGSLSVFADDGSGTFVIMADDGAGALVNTVTGGGGTGTVNYTSGAVSVTFPGAIPASNPIEATWYPYTTGRPTLCLFFNSQFLMRPVPDRVYRMTVVVNRSPTALLAAGTSPEVEQWWQYIAFGASMKVVEDRGDMDTYRDLMPLFMNQQNLVLYRTIQQQKSQRTATIFTQQLGGSYDYLNQWGGNI